MNQKSNKNELIRRTTHGHFKIQSDSMIKIKSEIVSETLLPLTLRVEKKTSAKNTPISQKEKLQNISKLKNQNTLKNDAKNQDKAFSEKFGLNSPVQNQKSFNLRNIIRRSTTTSADFSNTSNILMEKAENNNLLKSIDGLKDDLTKKTIQLKVAARFRPFNKVELELSKSAELQKTYQIISDKTISFNKTHDNFFFTFDKVFDTNSTQAEVYQEIVKETIDEVLKGYNGTIFAYGQSGSGKTHTMYGVDIHDEFLKGIVPRSVHHIFDYIEEENNKDVKFEIKFSLLEIYKEQLYDLLNPDIDGDHSNGSRLKIKEKSGRGVYIEGLTEEYISELEEFFEILNEAEKYRVVSETYLNKASSRSHMLLKFEISQKFPDGIEKKGILNLVDLAGSEKVSKTGAQGETLEEAKKINLSLSALGMVISNLSVNNIDGFVPYRDSKLTRILQDSLGGNFKTTLIVTCSPHIYNAEETLSTLNFAQRAKKVKTTVGINVKRSPEELEKIIIQLENEIKKLKTDKINTAGSLDQEASKKIYSLNHSQNNQIKFYKSDDESILSDENSKNIYNHDLDSGNNCNILFKSLKEKDQELKKLKDEISELRYEVKTLKCKLEIYNKDENENNMIKSFENLLKFNLEEFKKLKQMDNYINKYVNVQEADIFSDLNKNSFWNLNNFKSEESQFENLDQCFQDENFTNVFKNFKNFKSSFEEMYSKFKNLCNFNEIASNNQITHEAGHESNTKLNFPQINLDQFKLKIDSHILSYDNLFTNACSYINKICQDLIKNKILNNEKESKSSEIFSLNKLKTSYINLSIINIAYEKIMTNFVNKYLSDFKKFYCSEYLKNEQMSRIDSMSILLENYMDLFQYVKSFKFYEDQKSNNNLYNSKEKEVIKCLPQRNIIRPVKKRSSYILLTAQKNFNLKQSSKLVTQTMLSNNLNVQTQDFLTPNTSPYRIQQPACTNDLLNISENLLPKNQINLTKITRTKGENRFLRAESLNKSANSSDEDSDVEISITKAKNYFKNNNVIQEHSIEDEEDILIEKNKNSSRQKRRITINSNNFNNTKSSEITNCQLVDKFNKSIEIEKDVNINFNSTQKDTPNFEISLEKNLLSCNLPTRNEKGLINSTMLSNNQSIGKDYTKLDFQIQGTEDNTILLLKRELNIHKNYTEILKKEISNLKAVNSELETNLREYNKNCLNLKDIDSFSKCIKILKSFYEQEVTTKDNKIYLLNQTFDEMLLKISKEKENLLSPIKEYYENTKNKILYYPECINLTNPIYSIAESYIKESGCATKKLDYIRFHGDMTSKDGIQVDFGSGLNSKFPSVSPLNGNLRQKLKGDDMSVELESFGDINC